MGSSAYKGLCVCGVVFSLLFQPGCNTGDSVESLEFEESLESQQSPNSSQAIVSPVSSTPTPAASLITSDTSPTSSPTSLAGVLLQPEVQPPLIDFPGELPPQGPPLYPTDNEGAGTMMDKVRLPSGYIYYVSPAGDDNHDGSIHRPRKTIRAAVDALLPGDLLYVRGGSYQEYLKIEVSGTRDRPITIKNYPNEKPKIIGEPGKNAIYVGGTYVVLEGLTVENPQGYTGIAIAGEYVTIRKSEIFNVGEGQGILVASDRNTIESNLIHDNGKRHNLDHGIYISGGANLILDNIVYNSCAYGIHVYNGYTENGMKVVKSNNLIRGNLTYQNGYRKDYAATCNVGGGIVVADGQKNNSIFTNIACANYGAGLTVVRNVENDSLKGNITCFNEKEGVLAETAGPGTSFTQNIVYNNKGVALLSNKNVKSNNNLYFMSMGTMNLVWENKLFTNLASYSLASGQDSQSRFEDPKFKNVPSIGFDASQIQTYDFCNSFNQDFCVK